MTLVQVVPNALQTYNLGSPTLMENTMKRIINCLCIVLLVGSVTVSAALASESDDLAALEPIIEAVRNGWLEADGTPFFEYFLDFQGARYIETGGQNEGLTDLVEHHVEPEGDALADFELDFSAAEIHLEGDLAWAVVDVSLNATIKSSAEKIQRKGYETFLFRRVDNRWKVVHTHSSTRPKK